MKLLKNMFKFDTKFFEKHQNTLLFIANKWYLRWLIGLNRMPENLKKIKIDKITPNSIHHLIGKPFTKKGKYIQNNKGYFFPRDRFAEALAYNLSPFCYFENSRQTKMVWRFSPIGILGCLLIALWPKSIGGFCFFGTTSSYYAGTGDGYVRYDTTEGGDNWNTATGYSTARGNNKGLDYTGNSFTCASYINTGTGRVQIYRALIPVDTSGVGSGSTISSSSLFLYGQSFYDGDNDAQGYSVVVSTNQADTSSIAYNDYGTFGSTALSDTKDTTNYSIVAYTEYILNSSGLSTINKSGYTKIGMREGHDKENSAPASGTDNGPTWYSSAETGTSKDPYLSVIYSTTSVKIVAGVAQASIKKIGGVAIASVKKIGGLA